LAITGTNGKTTVTALTTWLVNAAGRTALAAGNIGPAALDALMSALDENRLPQVWVLELSSFQLESVRSLEPTAATVLNITEDHLDWHGTLDAYAATKARIFSHAKHLVVNRSDARVRAMVERIEALEVCSFGVDEPKLAGDLGLEGSSGMTWLAEATF